MGFEAEHALEHMHDEDHPMWRTDRILLRSTGIDIGSTTSHLMFCEIVLRRQGLALSSRFQIVDKKVVYESGIMLTPFLHGTTIDAEALSRFIDNAYAEAGLTPANIDTGAVILTGEAAKKDNAEAISDLFSAEAGKFVCATAGPNLEARMAAYGSGAVAKSLADGETGPTVMNVDIGGGTSKIAIVQDGCVIDTASVNVGARLIAFGNSGEVVRVEDAARLVARELGFNLELGRKLDSEKQAQMARALATSLLEVMRRGSLSKLTQGLMQTPVLSYAGKVDTIIFSGGVSEYIYGLERISYGDLGALLAEEVMRQVASPDFGIPVEVADQRIRATVIGASQYTVQVSGSTIFVSDNDMLPLRNLPVLTPRIEEQSISSAHIERAIRDAFEKNDLAIGERPVALAFHWPFDPSYPLIRALAGGIGEALSGVSTHAPVILVFDSDIGRLVGNMLRQDLGFTAPLISIDGVELQDFDYIDIGKQVPDADVVPVVIKSLLFRPGAQF